MTEKDPYAAFIRTMDAVVDCNDKLIGDAQAKVVETLAPWREAIRGILLRCRDERAKIAAVAYQTLSREDIEKNVADLIEIIEALAGREISLLDHIDRLHTDATSTRELLRNSIATLKNIIARPPVTQRATKRKLELVASTALGAGIVAETETAASANGAS